MRRVLFFVAAGLVAGAIGSATAAPAGVLEECVRVVKTADACVSVSETDPVEARAGAAGPHGTSSAHIGFVRNPVPVDGACGDPTTHRPPLPVPLPELPRLPQLPPLPVPLPGLPVHCQDAVFSVYEIDARSDTPIDVVYVHGEGDPVPCLNSCQYDVTAGVGRLQKVGFSVCYPVSLPDPRC